MNQPKVVYRYECTHDKCDYMTLNSQYILLHMQAFPHHYARSSPLNVGEALVSKVVDETIAQTVTATQGPTQGLDTACGNTIKQEQQGDVAKILIERTKTYGHFMGNATISQELKSIPRSRCEYYHLTPDQREAIDMILHKISRIVCGNPKYKDSWVDIQGYAKLVSDTLA